MSIKMLNFAIEEEKLILLNKLKVRWGLPSQAKTVQEAVERCAKKEGIK